MWEVVRKQHFYGGCGLVLLIVFRHTFLVTPSFQLWATQNPMPFALPSTFSRLHFTATVAETSKTAQDPAAFNAVFSTSSKRSTFYIFHPRLFFIL
jgi:hypothetical protein